MAVTAQWLFYNYTMIENYTFLRNESQFLKFLHFRQVVVSAKCLFGEKTFCPFDKMSVRLSVCRQSVFRQNVRVPLSLQRPSLVSAPHVRDPLQLISPVLRGFPSGHSGFLPSPKSTHLGNKITQIAQVRDSVSHC